MEIMHKKPGVRETLAGQEKKREGYPGYLREYFERFRSNAGAVDMHVSPDEEKKIFFRAWSFLLPRLTCYRVCS